MNEESALDEVTDLIANIEMHRQEIERESGLAASGEYALRRLQRALLEQQEETKLHGSSAERLANAEALTIEIGRIKTLAANASRRPTPPSRRVPPGRMRDASRDAQRKHPAPRGRKTIGRQPGR